MLSDEDIKKLWEDPAYPGSYSGSSTRVSNFVMYLKLHNNEDVSKARVYRILKTIPNYIYQLRSPKRYPTRHYDVKSFGMLIEIDLAFLTPYNKQIGYLLAIDAFSHHIWCTTIRNKSGPTIKKALETVFDSIQHPVQNVTASVSEVSSDQESANY